MKGYFFTIVLSYGGAIVALFNPFVGLLAYIIFANIRPEFTWFWAVPEGGNYSRIVAGGLLLGWTMQEFLRWRERDREVGLFTQLAGFALRPILALVGLVSGTRFGDLGRGRLVVASLVAFLFWSVLSASLARDQFVAWRFVEILAKIVLPIVAGIYLVDSMLKLKILAWTVMLSQAFLAWEANLSYYEGYNRLYWDGIGGVDNNSACIGMVTALGLAFFLGLYSESWWLKGVAFASAVLLGHSVMFGMSRGGMLAMIFTGAAMFLLIRKTWRHYLVLGLALLLAARLAGAEVRERFLTTFASGAERDASADSRVRLWRACAEVMAKHPVFGLGPDHWPLNSQHFGFTAGKEAHTLWLQVGAETGVVGLALLVGYYALCCFRLWPLARGRLPEGADPWLSYLAAAVIAALIGFVVSAQFVSLKLLEIPYYTALIGAAVLKMASAAAEEASAVEPDAAEGLTPVPGTV